MDAGKARPRQGSVLSRASSAAGAAVVSLVVAAACLRTLVGDGYVMQVDRVSGPLPPPIRWNFSLPVDLLDRATTLLVGGSWSGRLYVLVSLAVCALAPMVLFRHASWPARIFAGIAGALNPWTYDRAADGQWNVAVAAALLFLWLAAWETLNRRPSVRGAILLSLAVVASVSFDAHVGGPLAVLTAAGVIATRAHPGSQRFKLIAASVVLTALLLSYGVIGFFAGHGVASYAAVAHYGAADFANFRFQADPATGVVVSALSLHGYWAEAVGRFVRPSGGTAWWPLTSAVLLGLAAVGAWLATSRRWLLGPGILGLLISVSTAIPGAAGLAGAVASSFPILGAYREPDKWSSLWLLAVVVFATGCLDHLWRSRASATRQQLPLALGTWLLAIAAVLAPTGRVAFQELPRLVTPARYPADWTAAGDYMRDHVPSQEVVAVLPWHHYEILPFAGGRPVLNPGGVVFPGTLLASDDDEIPGSPPPSAIAAAARQLPAGGCNLSEALGREAARWAVVEAAPGRDESVDALLRCGWTISHGGPGLTSVLQKGVLSGKIPAMSNKGGYY
jgi:hypothetical protein